MSRQSASSEHPSVSNAAEQERTEPARQEIEQRLATLLRNLPGIAYRCRNDEHWTMVFVSQGCLRLTGYEPAELLGNRQIGYNEIIHPDDRTMVRTEVQRGIAEKRQFQLIYRIRTQDGTEKHVWEQGVAILSDDGQVTALEGFITDITEQKRAEEALQVSNGQLEQLVNARTSELQAIYDGMADGVLIADIESQQFLLGNAAAARMLGYGLEEVTTLSLSDIHPPDHVEWIRERFHEHAEGRANRTIDMPYRQKDGTVRYADITTSLIEYRGRPCLIGFLRDVTDRRQAEEALRREKEALRLLLLASDHERRVIAYEIHDTVAQQLAGAALHLEGYQQLLAKQPPRAAEAFQAGMRALRQCQADVRRLIAGVRSISLDQAGVEVAIRQLIDILQRDSDPTIEFQCDVQFDRLESVQENAIYRIVQEGLRNACKHSHSQRVRVELRQAGDRVRIVVQDWGQGFDPATIGGYHFGLDAIRERARLLNGHAEINSSLGEGTCVTVEMPLMFSEDEG
jgi:PAS domain S-box-containing protein